jgi:sterol desaturase/sphingolipid hydroxylase (fatty acid hydroxylase superfamily)
MQEKVITLATPVFFALIALELAWGWLRGRNTYRLDDAVNSIGLGVLSQVSGVFARVLRIGIYAWAFEFLALWRLPADSAWVWLFALLFYDLCYYWYHRIGHERTLFWAAHVVHHQSEDYNLSTALRQTSSGALLGWLFYLPMAVAGVPPEVFAAVALVDLLYQYWIHTQHVGRLGWFDRVFASPSNHRVHHAVNDRYLDRNYGGILILWDRLFGTFADEDPAEPPVYGTRSPLRSWNPLWANFEVYAAMAHDAWHTRRWRDRLGVLLGRTGWRPEDVARRFPKPAFSLARPRYAPATPARVQVYALAQFALLLGAAVHFLRFQAHASSPEVVGYFAWIVVSLTSLGILLEGRRVGAWLEAARAVFTAAGIATTHGWFGVADPGGTLVIGAAAGWVASAVWAIWLSGSLAWRARPGAGEPG